MRIRMKCIVCDPKGTRGQTRTMARLLGPHVRSSLTQLPREAQESEADIDEALLHIEKRTNVKFHSLSVNSQAEQKRKYARHNEVFKQLRNFKITHGKEIR